MKIILILLFKSNFWPCLINLKNAKPLKKIDKELMPVTLHPTRWWIGSCYKMIKKKIKSMFTDKVGQC